jgi:hypothetical protein
MNHTGLFHMPTQSFPTDVTAPVPSQLSGPSSGSQENHPSVNPPRPESEQSEEVEDDMAALASL